HATSPYNLRPPETALPIVTTWPASTGIRNAAELYLSATDHYNRRRTPFTQASKLYAFADEPPLEPIELALLAQGAMQQNCDLYERAGGTPRFSFTIEPGDKAWPMEPARDPYAMRPYVTVFRLFCVAALNEAKRMER